MDNLSIMGIIASDTPNACDAYRVLYPLRALGNQGVRSVIHKMEDVREMARLQDPYLLSFDIYVMSRITGTEFEFKHLEDFCIYLRALGKSVIIDYDDDYTNVHRKVHDYELGGLDHVSALTVSTPYLQQVMKPYAKEVHVMPNLVVPEMFQGFNRVLKGPVIGLTGSTTHIKDWETVYEPIKQICAEFPEVEVFCSGYVPPQLKGLPNLVTLKDLDPDIRVEGDNYFIPLKQYGFVMRNIDILLVPVDPKDKFNWSKSNLKAIEGQVTARPIGDTQGGACVIATGDIPIYRDAITNGVNGLLIDHADQAGWTRAIRRVLTDVEYRQKLQCAGNTSVLRDFNIHTQAGKRMAAYRRIMAVDSRKLTSLRSLAASRDQLEPV